jgi:hypothetical protein
MECGNLLILGGKGGTMKVPVESGFDRRKMVCGGLGSALARWMRSEVISLSPGSPRADQQREMTP